MEIKGDLRAKRTLQADRRMDSALSSETLTGNRTIVRHDYQYLNLDPNGSNRDATLPDATTLPTGWKIGIRNSGGANNIVVKDNGGSTLKTVSSPAGSFDTIFYEFVLLTNGSASGTWAVLELGDPGAVAATRSVASFTSGDFPAAVSGYRTLTGTQISGLLASNHGRGTNPTLLVQEESGSDFVKVLVDQEKVLANGDIELRVVDGSEFNGRVIII